MQLKTVALDREIIYLQNLWLQGFYYIHFHLNFIVHEKWEMWRIGTSPGELGRMVWRSGTKCRFGRACNADLLSETKLVYNRIDWIGLSNGEDHLSIRCWIFKIYASEKRDGRAGSVSRLSVRKLRIQWSLVIPYDPSGYGIYITEIGSWYPFRDPSTYLVCWIWWNQVTVENWDTLSHFSPHSHF